MSSNVCYLVSSIHGDNSVCPFMVCEICYYTSIKLPQISAYNLTRYYYLHTVYIVSSCKIVQFLIYQIVKHASITYMYVNIYTTLKSNGITKVKHYKMLTYLLTVFLQFAEYSMKETRFVFHYMKLTIKERFHFTVIY